MESTSFVKDAAEVIGLLIGIGTVLTAIWRYIVRPLWRWGRGLSTVTQRVERIWQELQPNGGSSIRDHINRQTDMITRIETRQLVSEQVDKQVFAALNLGVVRCDALGRVTEINRNYSRITGRTFEEVSGTNWSNCVHPDDRESLIEEWRVCVEEGKQLDRQMRFVRPDGYVQVVHSRACALLNGDGKTIGWFGTIEKLGEAHPPLNV